MSDQQNTQLVQDAYAAFKRGDIPGLINMLSDDVDWTTPGEGMIPQAGKYHGKDEVRGFFQKLTDTTEFQDFNPTTFIAQGDKVVATGNYRGTTKPGGASFQAESAMVFTLRGGKIAKFQEYTDTGVIAAAYARTKAA